MRLGFRGSTTIGQVVMEENKQWLVRYEDSIGQTHEAFFHPSQMRIPKYVFIAQDSTSNNALVTFHNFTTKEASQKN